MIELSKRVARAARVLGKGVLVLVACAAIGCSTSGGAKNTSSEASATQTSGGAVTPPAATEPDRIQVQHVLVGFKGSVPGKPITRTQEEAKTLAYEILERAKQGESFDELVTKYTDDSPPGIYGMTNKGVPADASKNEFARTGMVGAFGDVGFKLAVGEVGIADYDPRTSPYGYHVIKRLR
jgi:hypothetical protein